MAAGSSTATAASPFIISPMGRAFWPWYRTVSAGRASTCWTSRGQIHLLVQAQSQFVIATHSPILMAYPGACLYQLSEEGIARADYRETEHYCLTQAFLADPERMLRYVFEAGD